jgi:hypothetical protein
VRRVTLRAVSPDILDSRFLSLRTQAQSSAEVPQPSSPLPPLHRRRKTNAVITRAEAGAPGTRLSSASIRATKKSRVLGRGPEGSAFRFFGRTALLLSLVAQGAPICGGPGAFPGSAAHKQNRRVRCPNPHRVTRALRSVSPASPARAGHGLAVASQAPTGATEIGPVQKPTDHRTFE